MLQCPSSLKQMNFKMECFSSLLVTINTEVIIFNIRLSIITKLDHEIQDQWHLASLLVYNSIHPSPGAFDLVYFVTTQRAAVPGYEHIYFPFSVLKL